jgi:hypothetical protein
MKIDIKTIPHDSQRYETPGDYVFDDDGVHISVSELGNKDYELLIAVHELVESYLVQKRGISEESISAYDKRFEALRMLDPETIGDFEPGHMDAAPYHEEHVFAERIERQIATELHVDWEAYNSAVNALTKKE